MSIIVSDINQAVQNASKMEQWKYTKLYDLKADDYVLAVNVEKTEFSKLPFDAYEIKFCNGKMISHDKLPSGVKLQNIGDISKNLFHKIEENYPFAVLNNKYDISGVCISVEKNVTVDKPIVFTNKTNSVKENIFYCLHNVLILEEGASAEFIENYIFSNDVKSRYFINIINDIYVEKAAELKHYKIQDEAFKANHIALNLVDVKKDAKYNGFCLQKGANVARNETRLILAEHGASAEINMAYIMGGWATIDTTTDVRHMSPYTFSDQLIKGVVSGEAKGVFQGKIHIAKDAVKTEGNQLHKALLLSDTAEVDVKPELEIFADDVKCTHGAATGVLDEMQLFYMRSRGISEIDAKQMLIDAYLDDVLSKISNNAFYIWVKDRIK